MAAGLAAARLTSPAALGGDRLYAVARWLLLAALFALFTLIYGIDLWPPGATALGRVFWSAAGFAALATGLTLWPRAQALIPSTYAGDLLWLSALAYYGPGDGSNYATLFLPPLLVAALRLSRRSVLLLSLLGVALAIGLYFKPDSTPDILTFASQAVMLAVLPWLLHIFSEQSTRDTRRQMVVAEQRASDALHHAEQYRDRMRALYEVALTLHSAGRPETLLETTLEECARVLPYTTGAIVLPTGKPDEVRAIAGRRLGIGEIGARFSVGRGTLGMILRGANGGVLRNAQAEPELAALPSIQRHPSLVILPLRSSQRTFGAVLFGSDEPELNVEQMEMATTLVSYALLALQNFQLIAELRAERENLLAREEEVRRQLNRDLHDGPAQALAAITMTLGFIKRLVDTEPQRVVPEIDKLMATAQRANHEVRTLLFELRPLVLETQGLVPTLQQYLDRFDQGKGPTISLEGGDELGPLTKRVQGTLFNIVQESVNNALKHADAQHIWIRIAPAQHDLTITVQDDGKGFDMQAVKASYDQRGSFGLLSLEERARLVGGSAELLSAPGAGTTVRVTVPLES
jgi:signal transduction histidine kinase